MFGIRLALPAVAAFSLVFATACSTTAGPAGQSPAAGGDDARTLSVTGFSGAFADQFKTEVIDPFQKAHPDITVKYRPTTNSAEMLAGLRTNKARATDDIVIIDSSVQRTANEEGLFAKLTEQEVPNLANLVDEAVVQEGYGPALSIDSLAIVYNPSLVKTPPTTWQGLGDKQYAGQLVLQIADTRGIALIAGLSKEMGRNYQDGIDDQVGKLAAMAPNVQTFQPQPNIYDAIRSGSAAIGAGWNARAQSLHDQTPDQLAVAVPKGGGVAQISTINRVASSKKTEAANAFIDFAIGTEAQKGLAERGFYGPVDKRVALPDNLKSRVAAKDGLLADAAPIDWAWISPKYADWVQRIQREVIGG
ncbi:extracellular solute-binding protein [Nonomuraea purpurea]|uniref:Extracellular solute-binding protein n=1 Tax=Nonomuraea purpurea TaxID=1849276 RepID=A0ABV8GL82_9ACTN